MKRKWHRNRIIPIVLLAGAALLLILIYYPRTHRPDFHLPANWQSSNPAYSFERGICLNFVENRLRTASGGIATNYLAERTISELAGGHQILSESEGLIMLFYAIHGQKSQFDRHLKLMLAKLQAPDGLFKWRILDENENLSDYSATIDDLRILRALIYAYHRWQEDRYYVTCVKVQKALYDHVVSQNVPTNLYGFTTHSRSNAIDLSYLDLYTIKMLIQIDRRWRPVFVNSLRLVEQGFISQKLPLYHTTYQLSTRRYLDLPDNPQGGINIIDALLSVLHLSEVGAAKKETLDWLRLQISDTGRLFNSYSLSGRPTSPDSSTAAYALAARIARNLGDTALYHAAVQKMLQLQVKDNTAAPLYGAFGDPETLKVYSFDNLQALLAL